MKPCILTNNPMVRDLMGHAYAIDFQEVDFRVLLRILEQRVAAGYTLLTHPLAGSVKPNETPYRSMALSLRPGIVDMESFALAAAALETCAKFTPRPRQMCETLLADLQLVDFTLIAGALCFDAEAALQTRHKPS